MATHNTNVVYIDTNLDTRFALLVSDHDTVADLKRSILSEHPLCFPQIGQIQINGIKVKREEHFYHLVDSMPVRSAFTGSLKSWLVSVDATVVRECSQNYQVATIGIVSNALTGRGDNAVGSPSKGVSTFGNLNLLHVENKRVENAEVPVPSPCVSQHSGKGTGEKLDTGVKSSVENNELPGSAMEYEVDGTNKSTGGVCVVRKERSSKSVSDLSRKRKGKRKKEDAFRDDTSNVGDASVVGLGDCAIQQDIEDVAKTLENANKEVIMEIEVLKEHQHTDCNNSNTKSDINTAVSMKEASEPELSADKKHKKRKRSLTDDSKEIFKEETAAQKDEAHKSDEAHEERKELKDQFELKNENYRYGVEYKDDKVTGDILDTPTKKKRKTGKVKSREKSSSKTKLIKDFNLDISSHHDLEDLQKIKNSNDDQSTEKFRDTDTLRTILGRRRKGKINSSNPHETPLITSSRNVEEEDHSSIQKGGQEEISLSKGPDMSMGKTTIDNMETGTDACKEDIQTTEKATGNYNNHSDIEIMAHPANVVGHMELTEDNDKNEAGQIEGAEEGRELSLQNNPNLMLLDKSTPSNQDNSDAKVRELNVTSKVVDVNGTTESRKSKKEKKKKKDKNSGGESPFREGIGHVDASESKTVIMKSLGATNCDPKSGNTETEENPLNQIGGKIQQEEMHGTSDKEIDFKIESAEHTGKRQRKKSNDKHSSISKSMPNMLLKDQGDSKNSPSSSDRETHAKSSVAVTKKRNSSSIKSSKKSSKRNTEPVKDSVRLEPSDSLYNSGSKDAVQLSTKSPGEKDDDNLEAPSKTLNDADEQFSSCKQPGEANLSDGMLVDKLNETKMKDIETITRNNIHQLEATNGQTHAKDLSSSQKLSSKEELDVRIHPGEKVLNAHRSGQDSKVSGNRTVIEENKKTRVKASEKKMDLEKQRKHVPVSNSKLEGSIKRVPNKAGKASGNNVRGVVGKTPQKKSLLSGAIFKDDSSSNSSDDEVGNSGASTRTPSDNPLLSDEDSSSGSYGGQTPENGGRGSSKASLTETKGMSIDDVLRSSSWFKKAKITASESQSIEFVPDSLAD